MDYPAGEAEFSAVLLVRYCKYKRKQPKSQVMNATQKQNRKAKAAGGYITLPPITKNRVAEAYYRRAMTEEIERMLTAQIYSVSNLLRFSSNAHNIKLPADLAGFG